MTTDQGTVDTAKQAASTAGDEGKHVASTAKDEARNVASTAADQARTVVGDSMRQAQDQLTEQASGQRDRLVGTLRALGDDLEEMAGRADSGGMAADLARQAASRARSLSSHLDGREPRQLLGDVRDFARRRPGTFLLGAAVAGVVAGRLFRATAGGAAAADLAPGSHAAPGGTVTGAPTTPTTTAPPVPSGTPPVSSETPVSPPGQPTIEAL